MTLTQKILILRDKYKNGIVLAIGLLAAFFVLQVYSITIRFDFVNWDDGGYVYGNYVLRLSGVAFVKEVFTTFVMYNWHPLTLISLKIDKILWGNDPYGYHLMNALLHSFNTFLVFLLALKIFSVSESGEESEKDIKKLVGALIAALLFGLHPIHVESVAWISERKDVLSTLFFVLGLIFYIEYKNSVSKHKTTKYVLTLLCFVFSVLSKPMAVTFPVVLLIIDYYPLQRFKDAGSVFRCFLEKMPFFVVSIGVGLTTIFAQNSAMGLGGESLTLLVRSVKAIHSFGFYIYKTIYPAVLVPLYPYPKVMGLLSPQFISAALFVVAATTVSVFFIRKRPYITATWMFYVLTLLPVIGLIQVGMQAAADRYMYIPSISVFILCGYCAASVIFSTSGKVVRAAALVAVCAVFIFLTVRTTEQIQIWRNGYTLWSHFIEHYGHESSAGYLRRGEYLFSIKSYDKAAEDYTIAIAYNPTDWEPYNMRGVIFASSGKIGAAEKDFKKAIQIAPNKSDPYENIAFLYKENNKPVLQKYYFSLAERVYNGGNVSDEELRKIMSRSEFF